jgi:murein L,D-transpeptidase YcbB/YkuD
MATSYNGWPASPNPADFGGLEKLIVAGESFAPGVRAGDVHAVFQYVAEQLHARVEPVVRADWHQADDWGYSYRANVNNPSTLSCHASGTAKHATVQRGSVGPDVELLQRFLGVVGPGDPGYGVFGKLTQAAVIKYQRMRGLVPDGVVGERTWRETGL